MQKIKLFQAIGLLFAALWTVGCADKQEYSQAVYVLIDTSGTYVRELDKAQRVINFLLGKSNPGDSLAVARVKNRSFTEKDIVAKMTLAKDPMQVNTQKLAFRAQIDAFIKETKVGSTYTDITGGVIQGAQFLNEIGKGIKTIVIFSDMQEDLDKKTQRQFPIDLKGIRMVALNVVKLQSDNIDPRLYMGRLEYWGKRFREAGATDFIVVNDMDHLERVFRTQ
jgi:hypothetical protein